MNVTLTLDRGTIDVPWARREVLAILAAQQVAADPQTVALVVTELVTNAVIHGGAPVELRVTVHDEQLRIEVRDGGGAAVPTEPTPPALTEASGRGLMIVDCMVDRWGVEAAEGGKVVWVEFDGPVEDLDPHPGPDVHPGPDAHRGPSTRSMQDTDTAVFPSATATESTPGTDSTRGTG